MLGVEHIVFSEFPVQESSRHSASEGSFSEGIDMIMLSNNRTPSLAASIGTDQLESSVIFMRHEQY